MANCKYEYVKQFEVDDEIMYPNFIVVRIDGHHFKRFSEVHEFEKPNDERGLKLMNACAVVVLEEYPDVICSTVVKKLRADVLHSTEEQLRAHTKQTVVFLTQLTAKTLPKGRPPLSSFASIC